MELAERIADLAGALTPAERRVAEVMVARPQQVAFGTVAEVAAAAGVGAATVVRLAGKLGYDGFSGLQAAVRRDVATQLRPAAERIREPLGGDLAARHRELERANVDGSLDGVGAAVLAEVADRLADPAVRAVVLSGEASRGVAIQFVTDLGALRDEVAVVDGNDVAVRRQLALLRPGDVMVVLDLRRYERWVVDAARRAADAGVWLVAVTDSVLSPLAVAAERTVVVSAAGSGPFDSHVGTLAVFNLIVSAVADRLREVAVDRLDRLEAELGESLIDR